MTQTDICPWCGAYSKRSCELEDEMGVCPWEESEPDPDLLREDRDGTAQARKSRRKRDRPRRSIRPPRTT